ncbi:helix-turn-helix transcriptional regulator [Saccharothrix australiensis]|uniref:Regulatory LuxR family protein n=1 Tax=Saccharothrix australiensis TaxID=2072 RepID=A0A495W392_9PSEU|nr:LuxR family transcriptional regulator [Saccharothrix australiensis]RKT56181.1 regulatory LuxR family protein [Saccharothrix australiensis]
MFLLEPVGLGQRDNDVYLALLELRRATAGQLAEHVGEPLPEVRAALADLVGAGLVHQLGHAPASYLVVAPDEALAALIQRRRGDLARMQVRVEELARRLRSGAPRPGSAVELVEGEDAVIASVTRLQAQAREEVLAVDAPPYLGGQWNPNDFEITQLASGVEYRFVYSADSLSTPLHVANMRRCVAAGEQARVLPDASMKMVIVDRSTALMPASYREPDAAVRLLVRESALIDVLVCCFEAMWARATPVAAVDPVDGAPERSPGRSGLSARDGELLALLSAGMKDRSIARALGVTERTVGRRVTELMAELGAQSRFQAGLLAARKGWI